MLKNSLRLQKNRVELLQAKLLFFFFIVSLGVFFLATLVSYCVVRSQAFHATDREYLALAIPKSFWISTMFLVLSSVLLQVAVWLVRRERVQEFRVWIAAALSCAVLFVIIQSFGMNELLNTHFTQIDGSTKIYGLCFTLAFVHALHVIGGVVFLVYVLLQSYRQKYDHERHWAVDNCAGYWHFLDVVWFAMLLTFLITK